VELADKVALVTGGAVRLGRAICAKLAEVGMDVCIHYGHSQEAAQETRQLVERFGRRAALVQCDFARCEEVGPVVLDAALDALGRVDVLVNNAAIFEPASLATTTREQFERHMAINVRAAWQLCQAFVGRLAQGQHGHIVNILDWRVMRPVPGHFSYTLSKAALWAATKILALELAPRVQVNAIAPGAILLPADAPPEYHEQLVARVPMKRLGSTSDVTETLLYLLRSDFITGAVIPVTGGEEL
jgi:NAD(P)-dependent dehydrogenase (short-subunit alcohol dehydrogenase family)